MRRIYQSRALERADDEPFAPGGLEDDEPTARTIDWAAFSHAVTPTAVRHRAIDVTVSTERRRYEPGDPVELRIEFRNRLPIPVRIRTESPNRWRWRVDGLREASQVPRAVPDRPAIFSFARNERKRFRRRWPQRIRVADDEWVPVDPGTYTIDVGVTRADASARGLVDRTEIEIVE
ncbi:hypothetical protein [Natrinema longum]|uniref:DUF7974 domain-containing protein n=1 Tax=Natrinema longum TaxID=370324 RepID=A0A8A2UBM0_9EURY|nr:hypothetical protein [Natrinema longum]MBZ6496058.1 hypothetical protein [Natrinema longum]QSW86013.1 hypothetical protein J0X27_04035 [Natrinema longum]